MSFITKRERVFNEYDLFDLPARNEGKLKAYASCTDARAWSHFCSDKTEHLVEIIKRNNEKVRPKYIPTDVIVNTLMLAKNAEITRLKRKIEEFEQMIAAYDQLDLTCDQKCDIANAHAAIKAANKELDEMCLDLDLSGFTEGIDSEGFQTGKSRGDETGKSRGDEWTFGKVPTPGMETKSNQFGPVNHSDASTIAHDPRIDDLQDTIISKDAKLSAMQNTIKVMENDVCEPYCIYAHIYTALEKIFGTLCQNGKYKQYLDLLTAGKDTRSIDIKGKILFKMKILEKFSLALIAPCSQDFNMKPQNCSCYRAEIITHVETTFALTSAESKIPNLDSKRAQLVADIMENQEMKEILSKESLSLKTEEDQLDECYAMDNYCIDSENLNRLKNLQANYDDLVNCYDSLKYERDCLIDKCKKYDNLEHECDCLQKKLNEYNQLWKDKEYYRKRSEDLDALKENYFILSDETSDLESKLNAEKEINKVKSKAVDDLRNENIKLKKQLSEASVEFEKQKNALICKLNEYECKIMCQDQQIKSLSVQIDNLLERDSNKISSEEEVAQSLELIDKINSQKEQIINLKNALCCCEEEKQFFQEEIEKKLEIINELKSQVEDWKSKHDNALQNNNYLEHYVQEFQLQINQLIDENKQLAQDRQNKSHAIENLNGIINNKSHEIQKLVDQLDKEKNINHDLTSQISNMRDKFDKRFKSFENEKHEIKTSIEIAKRESLEIINDMINSDVIPRPIDKKNIGETLNQGRDDTVLRETIFKNEPDDLNKSLTENVKELQEINLSSIQYLHDKNIEMKNSYQIMKKESTTLENTIKVYEDITQKYEDLKKSYNSLMNEKDNLQTELNKRKVEVDNLVDAIQLTKKKSESLMNQIHQSENIQEKYEKMNENYKAVIKDRNDLEKKIGDKETEMQKLLQALSHLKKENNKLQSESQLNQQLHQDLIEINKRYEKLLLERNMLQNGFDEKSKEINNLRKRLENQIEESQILYDQINKLEVMKSSSNDEKSSLKNENLRMQTNVNTLQQEKKVLIERLKYFENQENELIQLKSTQAQMTLENESLQHNLEIEIERLKLLEIKNYDLSTQCEDLQEHNKYLEEIVIKAHKENLSQSESQSDFYAEIKKEIKILKEEKLANHKKIRDLLDKLEELETIKISLFDDISSKDIRISTLENYINELEDEIRKLHSNLAVMVESGEQLKKLSYEKIDQSLKNMEALHSKATHNMKMDIARLQNKNAQLENQLSSTNLNKDASLEEKHKYFSLVMQLQKEKNLIVSHIHELELKVTGSSELSANDCTVTQVIESLDRINKSLDDKENSLEKTLLNVQASYQLLESKADEAKKNAEIEKQKIIKEKEEAKQERENIEQQLQYLKSKLEKDKINYEGFIKDLQGEILNQKLISDKITKSKEDYIFKLEEKIKSTQELYTNALSEMQKLQQLLQNKSDENTYSREVLDKTNASLDEKNKEIVELKSCLETLKNKQIHHIDIQTFVSKSNRDMASQSDQEETMHNMKDDQFLADSKLDIEQKIQTDKYPERNKLKSQVNLKLLPKSAPPLVNDVQILTANVQPTIDFIRNMYLDYKMKRLSPGRLEQYSISRDNKNTSKDNILLSRSDCSDSNDNNKGQHFNVSYFESVDKTPSLTFIYNSSKILPGIYDTDATNKESRSPDSSNINVQNTDTYENIKTIDNNKLKNIINGKDSSKNTDNDLFVIYKDSDSIIDENIHKKSDKVPHNVHDYLVSNIQAKHSWNGIPESLNKIEGSLSDDDNQIRDDDSLKPKLNIDLPRITNDSHSSNSLSDNEQKSADSYTLAIYASRHTASSETNLENITISSTRSFEKVYKTNNDKKQKSYLGEPKIKLDKYERNKRKHAGKDNSNDEHQTHDIQHKNNTVMSKTSSHKLERVEANTLVLENKINNNLLKASDDQRRSRSNYGLKYILNAVQNEINPSVIKTLNSSNAVRQSQSNDFFQNTSESSPLKPLSTSKLYLSDVRTSSTFNQNPTSKSWTDRGILVKLDPIDDYENRIQHLTLALETTEKDYKKKIEAIKLQYDNNVKSIINEHNQGVESIQSLHEDTLHDIIKIHENEIENLRSMSIEAMRKVEKLEMENYNLKTKLKDYRTTGLDEEPVKISTPELKRKRCRSRIDARTLTKTKVEAFNVKPRRKSLGPCTCSADVNVSDTIRNIFEQVDVEQRKMAEQAYLKYIANKISNNTVELLDAQELSFLHLKICRAWKTKLNKEEAMQKKIDTLENDVMIKQRQAQKHMAELDRKVAEEWQRLQEVREAVCRSTPPASRDSSPPLPLAPPQTAAEKDNCNCNSAGCNITVGERKSAGDLTAGLSGTASLKHKRGKQESNRAVLAKLDVEERRDKRLNNEETPTRLRRHVDRQALRPHKR